ncbi:MAG TPA: DUF4350 domain-containing protein [Steroidobacteraceae bacterium]|jgi:hypothetical protein|nr:DUF4350 domain-containing protein [Steroidobacteraceae bacterium]
MRERWVTLLLAAGALAAFYALFFPKPQTRPVVAALPLSTDKDPAGYWALWHWLGEESIAKVSLRVQYGHLSGLLKQPTGNLLLVTMPQRVATDEVELTALDRWVAQGNTVLIVAALEDDPAWAIGTLDPLMTDRLQRLTGLRFTAHTGAKFLQTLSVGKLDVRPRGNFPLLGNIRHITTLTYLARSWRVGTADERLPLELASRSDNGDPVMWLERQGAGQIILCAVASPFSNAGVLHDDNAALLGNIIAWSRGPGGAVVFDDAHQGLTAYYDARAFFADPRLHGTLGWIVLIWLAFVLGPQPLRVRRREWQPLDETVYVEASARYLAAVVRPGAAAQRLIEDFLDWLRGRLRLEPGEPDHAAGAIWQWLETQAAVPAAARLELQACYASACAGERPDLTRLQNLLAQLRRTLS